MAGCASNRVKLLEPDAYTAEPVTEQLYSFQISFGDNNFECLSMVTLNSQQIEIYLFNQMAFDLGSLYYDGNELSFDSDFLPPSFDAAYIVSDIQNIFYDEQKLAQSCKKQGLSFTQVNSKGGFTRTISNKNGIIESIVKQENTITLKNSLRGYEYILTRVED